MIVYHGTTEVIEKPEVKYRVLSFEKENEKWLEFVCACRKGEPLNTVI